MSIKDLFKKEHQSKILSDTSVEDLSHDAESPEYVEGYVEDKNKFIPNIDFTDPSNFAHFGSAEKYYEDSINRILQTYPFDGSAREKIQWHNSSSYLDNFLFEKEYPRTNGYALFSPNGWGTSVAVSTEGYGAPPSASMEYIKVKGGPNEGPNGGRTGANIYKVSDKRASNLAFNGNVGTTVEFWIKKGQLTSSLSEKEVIFDLYNGAPVTHSVGSSYGRFIIALDNSVATSSAPLRVTYVSGTVDTCTNESLGVAATLSKLTDQWNHIAISAKNLGSDLELRLHLNGELDHTKVITGGAINEVTGALIANIGALRAQAVPNEAIPSDEGWGKLSGSLDEFRYWKCRRSSKDVGRHWFSQVNGGTNVDTANTELGIYYKFNEGIVGNDSLDARVLDYSGRISHGTWTGYATGHRSTGSAIVEAEAERFEFKDPIIYSSHPDVKTLQTEKSEIGSNHDNVNNASIYNSIPNWIINEDKEKDGNQLKNLTQIMSSFFDDIHLKIQELSKLHDVNYISGSVAKPMPFAARLLESAGFIAPEIFVDASILSQLTSRDEKRLFKRKLHDIKNMIYQNVYNNLTYIYKSKGTEKAFRNLIRCFGVDDELIKINLYGDNVTFDFKENYRSTTVRKKYVDFNNVDRFIGTVYQKEDDNVAGSISYISGSNDVEDRYLPFTVECEVIFPKKFKSDNPLYFQTPFVTSSLFGMHTATSDTPGGESDLTWESSDIANFQVYAVRDQEESRDVYFVLTSSTGGAVPLLTSSLYKDIYDNTKWNFAVRLVPNKHPLIDRVSGSTVPGNYNIEFYGVQTVLNCVINEFHVSASIASGSGQSFSSEHKRLYCGAHRTNFTGSLLQRTDVKISSLRYWFDKLENEEIKSHAYDATNVGRLRPFRNAHLNLSSLERQEIPSVDTLALHWDFATVTGSGPSSGSLLSSNAKFFVEDVSSGSVEESNSKYSWLGRSALKRHTGRGDFFLGNDNQVVDKEYVLTAKQKLPEVLDSSDMIEILNQDDEIFTRETRPVNHFFAIEKSMYQNISEEMINFFATIKDFNNIIGEPVHRYRRDYKEMQKLRSLFFERVGNTPDFEKYVEFYKWIDEALSQMLQKLVPASANISEDIRTVIESHVLERNKYQTKFPTLEIKQSPPEAGATSINRHLYSWKSGSAPVGLDQTKNATWWKERAERDRVPFTEANVANSRGEILSASLQVLNRSFTTPLRMLTNIEATASTGIRTLRIENVLTKYEHDIPPFTFINGLGESVETDGTASYSASISNYSFPYQIVQTSGRRINNRALVVSGSLIDFSDTIDSTFVAGLEDYAKVRRGKHKHIFVERFSAPGGPETAGDSDGGQGLDRESAEYSVYNSLNYRNMIIRFPLTELHTKHAGQFGVDTSLSPIRALDYNTSASFHKVHRNSCQRIELSGAGEQTTTASVYDNWFVQHPIPQCDVQYRWISASYLTAPFGHTSNPSAITFVSASDFGSVNHTSGVRFFGHPREDSSNPLGAFSKFIPTDFAGLNINIYEPLTSSLNTLGYPIGSNIKPIDYLNYKLIDLAGLTGSYEAAAFNAIMLNRNGPYEYPSWKQIRNAEHKIVREHRKNNIISILEPSDDIRSTTIGGQRLANRALRSGKITNFVEPPVTNRYKPFVHEIISDNEKNERQVVTMKHTYGNNLGTFANTELVNKVGAALSTPQVYDTIIKTYVEDENVPENPSKQFKALLYREKIFPKEANSYLGKVRGRRFYDVQFWKNERNERNKISRNSYGQVVSQSIWGLDGRFSGSTSPVASASMGYEGELQNKYSIFFDCEPKATSSLDWGRDPTLPGNTVPWVVYFNKDGNEDADVSSIAGSLIHKYNNAIFIHPPLNNGFWEYQIGTSGPNKCTLSAWVNFTSSFPRVNESDTLVEPPDFQTIMEFGDRRMALGVITGSTYGKRAVQFFRDATSNPHVATTISEFNVNTWYHILVTHDATSSYITDIYVNGVREPSTIVTGSGIYTGLYGRPTFPASMADFDLPAGDWALLGSSSNNDFPLEGMLSNVSVFNDVLTTTEISEVYNQGHPQSLYRTTAFVKCVGWWMLGGGYGIMDPFFKDQALADISINAGASLPSGAIAPVEIVSDFVPDPLFEFSFGPFSGPDIIRGLDVYSMADMAGLVTAHTRPGSVVGHGKFGPAGTISFKKELNHGLKGISDDRDGNFLNCYKPAVVYNRPVLIYPNSSKSWTGFSVTSSGNAMYTASWNPAESVGVTSASSDYVKDPIFYTNIARYIRVTASREIAGDVNWSANIQAGVSPFVETYDEFSEDIKFVGKDYSIIPEFRISEHMDFYIENEDGNFLADREGFLTLTGSDINNESDDSFYKVYSHSDFMKYFEVINEDHKNIGKPSELKIKCKALLKFLPYKGFYPQERTLELATLFSESYSDYVFPRAYDTQSFSGARKAAWRSFSSPFFGPGILYNSIKSGMAVDFPIYNNEQSPPKTKEDFPAGYGNRLFDVWKAFNETYPVQDAFFTESSQNSLPQSTATVYTLPISGGYSKRHSATTGTIQSITGTVFNGLYDFRTRNDYQREYGFDPFEHDEALPWRTVLTSKFDLRIPFEGLVEPENWLAKGPIWDMEPEYSSSFRKCLSDHRTNQAAIWSGNGSLKYKLAMHNFLAEVPNFFLEDGKFTTFSSKPVAPEGITIKEDDAKSFFGMDVIISNSRIRNLTDWHQRKKLPEFNSIDDAGNITKKQLKDIKGLHTIMYNRDSAFGPAWVPSPQFINLNNDINFGGAIDPASRDYEDFINRDLFVDDFNAFTYHYGYEPFTPAYFNGFGLARIIFYPFKGAGNYTLDEIQTHLTTSYYRMPTDRIGFGGLFLTDTLLDWNARIITDQNLLQSDVIPSHDNLGASTPGGVASQFHSASVNWMQLSASVNLLGKTKVKKVTYQRGEIADFEPATVEDSESDVNSIWTIQPKWETPIFNFINTSEDELLDTREEKSKGIWHQFGEFPQNEEGIWFEVSDIPNVPLYTSDCEEDDDVAPFFTYNIGGTKISGEARGGCIWINDSENKIRLKDEPARCTLYIRDSSSIGSSSFIEFGEFFKITGSSVNITSSTYVEPFNLGVTKDPGNYTVARNITFNINDNSKEFYQPTSISDRFMVESIQKAEDHPWVNSLGTLTDDEVYAVTFRVRNTINIDSLPSPPPYAGDNRSQIFGNSVALKYPHYWASGETGNNITVKLTNNEFGDLDPVSDGWMLEGGVPLARQGQELTTNQVFNREGRERKNETIRGNFVSFTGGRTRTHEVKSLADLMGFSKTKKRLGKVNNEKVISESVVAIPFIEDKGDKKFFKISRRQIDLALGKKRIKTGEQGPGGSIIRMVEVMQKYVIPPKFDFITNETVEPLAMYLFEFEHTLTKEDMRRIWQNLPPQISKSYKLKEAAVGHSLLENELMAGNIESSLRWMVFKVKRKAERNYFAQTADSEDDKRFKFNFEIGSSDSGQDSIPKYSYNWPYDFFSLIELAKIDTEVKIETNPETVLAENPELESTFDSNNSATSTGLDRNATLRTVFDTPQLQTSLTNSGFTLGRSAANTRQTPNVGLNIQLANLIGRGRGRN